MNMQQYRLPLGWTAAFPADWTHEYDETTDQNIFYPADSDLTFRLTALHAEKEGVPAPVSLMETVFAKSVPEGCRVIEIPELQVAGCTMLIRGRSYEEDGKTVSQICAGCFCDGELLTFNIFGTDPQQVYEGLAYLTLVQRTGTPWSFETFAADGTALELGSQIQTNIRKSTG